MCRQLFRSTGNNLGLQLASEVQGSLVGLVPLPVGSDASSDSIRAELNCRAPRSYRSIACWVWVNLPCIELVIRTPFKGLIFELGHHLYNILHFPNV